MKNCLYEVLKSELLENQPIIYGKALSYSEGDIELTYQRIAYAVEQTAKSYPSMRNRDKAMDMVFQKLSESPKKHYQLKANETGTIIEEILDYTQKKKKLVRIFSSIGAGVSVVFVLFIVVVQIIGGQHGNADILIMQDTEWIEGDSGTVSLVNYHSLSDRFEKNAKYQTVTDVKTFLNRIADTITAPDGNTYLAYQNLSSEENGENITFSLYQMTEDDWIEKGCGNLSASIQILDESTGYYGYSTSNMHLIADDDSNVYVLVILDGNIVVYKYDSTTKNFEKTQAEYSAAEMVDYRFSVYYDSQSGKSGTIYIGFTDFVVVYFAGYDIATDSFFTYANSIYPGVPAALMTFCVKNENIHILADGHSASRTLTYCSIQRGGEFVIKPITLNASKNALNGIEAISINVGGATVEIVDDSVYVIATHTSYAEKENNYLVYYKINTDGTFERNILSPLFFKRSEYYPLCVGAFSKNNSLYYVEMYKDTSNFFAIGKIENDGTVSYVDSFELPNEIGLYGMRVHNQKIILDANDNIVYFQFLHK